MNKKASILYVLHILEKETDESHTLTQEQLLRRLESDYGLVLERKSVASSLQLLKEAGYDIRKAGKGGYALYRHILDEREIPLLYDALYSSSVLSKEEAKKIFGEILSKESLYHERLYPLDLAKAPGERPMPSKEILQRLSLLKDAIEKKCKVLFSYLSFDKKGAIVPRKKDAHYEVSPYYLLNDRGTYYLLGSYKKEGKTLQLFRLDLLSDLSLSPLKAVPLKMAASFDPEAYLERQDGIGGGEIYEASFRLRGEAAVIAFKDAFGKKGSLEIQKGSSIGRVRASKKRLLSFAFENLQSARLLSPDALIDALTIRMREGFSLYDESQASDEM